MKNRSEGERVIGWRAPPSSKREVAWPGVSAAGWRKVGGFEMHLGGKINR